MNAVAKERCKMAEKTIKFRDERQDEYKVRFQWLYQEVSILERLMVSQYFSINFVNFLDLIGYKRRHVTGESISEQKKYAVTHLEISLGTFRI